MSENDVREKMDTNDGGDAKQQTANVVKFMRKPLVSPGRQSGAGTLWLAFLAVLFLALIIWGCWGLFGPKPEEPKRSNAGRGRAYSVSSTESSFSRSWQFLL
jgi:hypothetical protein